MKIETGGFFKILYYWYQKEPVNHKYWNFQLSWAFSLSQSLTFVFDSGKEWIFEFNFFNLFKIHTYRTVESDHAGFRLNIRLLILDVDLNHIDIRHWNYDEDRWETQEDIDAQNLEYNNSLNNNKNESTN